MDYTTGFFYKTFTPCSERRLTEIEDSLGVNLPESYRELLQQTGGGYFGESQKWRVPMGFYKNDYSVGLGQILGNDSIDSLEDSPDLMGEDGWGAPNELLIFAFSINGPGESFGINYGLEQFSQLSIIYVDIEADNEMVKVADSFEEFMGMLTTDDESES
ncbi:hypothetical protein Csp1_03690 [Corynebacterium provencense]|uniref:Knr4/Smi1-like domain-containing protein n=1 Tax=Corynebacterium provencense TaxID=1737425 RepID=A0A2Z3YUQ3_9CORY|nr:SMI1/KNR4 family protein [Corynebacterium provencense]AWT25193.1 hypothetical protein Csp1_03690 [Corynebacterium provencense]